MTSKTVTFPRWPTWNFHFPEIDVWEITAVRFFDTQNNEQQLPLAGSAWRSDTTESGIVFKEKHTLPELTAEREDAVTIDRVRRV
jgi:hypothetical protein